MDYNNYLLLTFLPYGPYDTHEVKISKKRVYINYFCRFICFFCALKGLIICVKPYSTINFMHYLIDILLLEGELNKIAVICSTLCYLFSGFIYRFYGQLSLNIKRMKCLNCFFMPNLDDLIKYYDLKLGPTKKCIKKIDKIRNLIWIVAIGFDVAFPLMIIRCLANSYNVVNIYYFIFISIPLGILTTFAFRCTSYPIMFYTTLQFGTIEFLNLRLKLINQSILKMLDKSPKANRLILTKKNRIKFFKNLRILNGVITQFKDSNEIFDRVIGPIFCVSLFGCLLYPAFFFFPNPIHIKLLYILLYVLVFFIHILTRSIYNDKFIYQIEKTNSTIHFAMCKFDNFRVKNLFNNFLILNNKHRHISFTFLNKEFDYNTNGLLEYLNHSLSLAFMSYQAMYL